MTNQVEFANDILAQYANGPSLLDSALSGLRDTDLDLAPGVDSLVHPPDRPPHRGWRRHLEDLYQNRPRQQRGLIQPAMVCGQVTDGVVGKLGVPPPQT